MSLVSSASFPARFRNVPSNDHLNAAAVILVTLTSLVALRPLLLVAALAVRDLVEPHRQGNEKHELVYWTEELGVSEPQLRELVDKHGVMAADIRLGEHLTALCRASNSSRRTVRGPAMVTAGRQSNRERPTQ